MTTIRFAGVPRLARGLALIGLTALALGATLAGAQDFPSRPIRMIVGFPPGGSNDIMARIVAPQMGNVLGVQVVIENKPGANATIGTDFVAKSVPDGHTILLASASPVVITPHAFDKIPYDTVRDFAGVGKIGVTPEAIRAFCDSVGIARKPARTEMAAYEHAVRERYRFYSYGDCCLLRR